MQPDSRSPVVRVVEAPEPDYDRSHHYHEASPFAARWIAHPDAPLSPDFDGIFVARYRLTVDMREPATVRVHVSADERYTLEIDGRPVGRGPERGDRDHWCFETYDLTLAPGPHDLCATVHSLGRHRGYAQVSVRHAFLLMTDDKHSEAFSTGVAPWTAERVDAYSPLPVSLPRAFVATGARFRIDGTALSSVAPAVPAIKVGPVVLASMRMESPPAWQLTPARLPPMLERSVPAGSVRQIEGDLTADAWQRWLTNVAPLVVPPRSTVSAMIDLNDYYCAYSRLTTDGGRGATIRMEWAEALFEADAITKRNRDTIDGLHFAGIADEFVAGDGVVSFVPLWWSAGRYVRLTVTTADAACTLLSLALAETRYPVTWDSNIVTHDASIEAMTPLARRAMEMCSHETYYDCPYYEQLMYVGDTRLEALVSYTHSRDDRLPRKAVQLFNDSRRPDGWTSARYPTRTSQVIPPFSWWWVAMVHDLAMWRDHPEEVRTHLPGVRAVMEAGYAALDRDGLYQPTTGWNFVDWVKAWPGGVPVGGADRPVAPIHLQFALAAKLAAELEQAAGDPLLAERHQHMHARMIVAARAAFFDTASGLFADDTGHSRFSEHAQSMAVLCGAVSETEKPFFADWLLSNNGLQRATIYYSHYVFEAYRLLGRVDAMFDRFGFWANLAAKGFKTTPEQPEPSRSDCHAWGAHPLFHLVGTVLGIRPTAPGFKRVHIEPQLGPLEEIHGRVIHPAGVIDIRVQREGNTLNAAVALPEGITGELLINGIARPIGAT